MKRALAALTLLSACTQNVRYPGPATPDADPPPAAYEPVPPLTVAYENDLDPTPDQIWTYTYDADGNRLVAERSSPDGSVTFRDTCRYEDEGTRVTCEQDEDADGTAYARSTCTYDAEGRLLTHVFERDTDGDGRWAAEYTYAYTYDADGLVLTMDDGGAQWRYTYTFDDQGNVVTRQGACEQSGGWSEERYTYDDDGRMLTEEYTDPVRHDVYTYGYDSDGNLTSKAYEDRLNLTDPATWTYAYDADGRRVFEEHDHTGTGYEVSSMTYAYDAAGNVVSATEDDDADHLPEWAAASTYGSDGNVLVTQVVDAIDSLRTRIWTYTYDADGTLLTETLTLDGNIWTTSYRYDDAGNLEHREYVYEYDGDEQLLETWDYTYDGAGNMLTQDYVGTRTETVQRSFTYTYDAAGNRLTGRLELRGTTNEDRSWDYDEHGHVRTVRLDGTEWTATFTNTYDTDGRLVVVFYAEDDATGFGLALEYDADGRLSTVEGDYWLYQRAWYEWSYAHAFGPLAPYPDPDTYGYLLEENEPGNVRRQTYTYDAEGRLVAIDEDLRANGHVDGRYSYTY